MQTIGTISGRTKHHCNRKCVRPALLALFEQLTNHNPSIDCCDGQKLHIWVGLKREASSVAAQKVCRAALVSACSMSQKVLVDAEAGFNKLARQWLPACGAHRGCKVATRLPPVIDAGLRVARLVEALGKLAQCRERALQSSSSMPTAAAVAASATGG
jgi:hypothetical protein